MTSTKGSWQRPHDKKKFNDNFDAIFKPKGEPYKLTNKVWIEEEVVIAIRKMRSTGTARAIILAAFPDVASATVDNVIYGKSFPDLKV